MCSVQLSQYKYWQNFGSSLRLFLIRARQNPNPFILFPAKERTKNCRGGGEEGDRPKAGNKGRGRRPTNLTGVFTDKDGYPRLCVRGKRTAERARVCICVYVRGDIDRGMRDRTGPDGPSIAFVVVSVE
ncbi:hypothetical protein GWI33_009136 [Rhynchophorus ferrugineus]|uniref:Uncharacterized protein n=1 Tax=Rhynchophorus ferrugineus TaxID=354439 RepID=A0A834IF43_RHYFE|nr:hypothetical protein GWI33_009136 [Rhynchophorus ferrugineus]